MAYIKKSKEPYLTAADRKRIADMDNNPIALSRKLKVQITLLHPKISSKVCIMCYGKDKNALKLHIAEHVDFFKKYDEQWKLIDIVDMKANLDNDNDIV